MQVGACGTASASHFGNDLTAPDQITLFHHHPGRVRVARHQIVAMIDLHQIAVAGVKFLGDDNSTRRRMNGCSCVCREIKPGMQR